MKGIPVFVRLGLPAALLATALCAQVSAPAVGWVRFDNQSGVQSVFGVPGSFVIGQPVTGAADAASFSEKAALLADNSKIKLFRTSGETLAEYSYRGETPVLSITDGPQSALAWLPGNHSLLTYGEGSFVEAALTERTLPGKVTSVSLISSNWASMLLMAADHSISEALISLPGAEVASIDLLPGVEGPAYRFGEYLIWRDDNGLEIESMIDSRQRHTLAAPAGLFTAERMSGQWLHLFFCESKTHWALQLPPGAPALGRLPSPLGMKATRP